MNKEYDYIVYYNLQFNTHGVQEMWLKCGEGVLIPELEFLLAVNTTSHNTV